MVPRGVCLGRSDWDHPEPEQRGFYDWSPPRMDASVCCLPTAGSGAQHQSHQVNLPNIGQNTVQTPYQYADQIVPDRGQPDALGIVVAGHHDNWQQTSSINSLNSIASTTTTTYIDYSWLQMQVRSTFIHKSKLFTSSRYLVVDDSGKTFVSHDPIEFSMFRGLDDVSSAFSRGISKEVGSQRYNLPMLNHVENISNFEKIRI